MSNKSGSELFLVDNSDSDWKVLQVCVKWLKDRKGRTLTDDDITHYHKIIVALSETIRLMSEIDTVINTHGGWPGAFVEKKELECKK